MFQFDLTKLTFSKRGSFLSIGSFKRPSGRPVIQTSRDHPYLDLEKQGPPREYYEIALFRDDTELAVETLGTPSMVSLQAEGARAKVTFLDDDTFLFHVEGAELVLLPCHAPVGRQWFGQQRCDIIDYRGFCVQQVRVSAEGELTLLETETVDGITGPYNDTPLGLSFAPKTAGSPMTAALRLRKSGGAWDEPLPEFATAAEALQNQWSQWLGRRPAVAAEFEATADTAWYLLWSITAAAEGLFQREPILVSNYWFNRIYAWDNCFHALGVMDADPELAAAQLQVLYDHQAPNGAIPEPLSDQRAHFAYIKPAVHGWCVLEMLRESGEEALRPYLPGLYDGIAKWTRWWLEDRDSTGNGLAEYIHGCDSGWDNATPFDVKVPVEGADLQAYLVLQLEALAKMASLLGKTDEAAGWAQRSTTLLKHFIKLRWQDGRFTSPGVGGELETRGNSLLDRIPIVLGHRLPEDIRRALLNDLRDGGPFFGQYGLATESTESPLYKENGYWRGPIWAPSTYLIFSGLRDSGETALARAVAERFCAMVARDSVFWENFDPHSGEGLCSPSMGWTAAAFLRMAVWLKANPE